MASERNEHDTNPIWQSTSTDSEEWDDPLDDAPRQTNVLGDENLAYSPEEDNKVDKVDGSSTSSLSLSELLQQVGQQFSPILVPLLFGGLTFLGILPFVVSGRAFVPLDRFWPIALVIVALAILQGMGLYYAGSNNVYWTMGIVGGFFLFLLIGCFTVFGSIVTLFLLLVLVALSVLGVRTYMRTVKEGTVVIVSAAGKYSRTLLPGRNFLLPWEKVEATVTTREVQWKCPEQRVRISREEDVWLHARISYQLEPDEAHIAALEVEKWEESLRELFRTALQTVAAELTPEDFLAWSRGFRSRQPVNDQYLSGDTSRWERINALLYRRMRDKVAQWGVQINWIQVHDIMLVPHVAVTADEAAPPLAGAPQPATQRATPPPTAAGASAKEAKSLDGAKLVGLYNSVKNGSINDPTNIRSIAARFQAIADDPEASKKVDFDAERAAQSLYARARVIEQQRSQASLNTGYNDVTQPDWNMRRPTDDNLMAGG
jgi:SPFH domain / Band 7 family